MAKRSWFLILVLLLAWAGNCFAAPVTSGFGWRVHPVTGQYKFHTGVDIGYSQGDDVRAVMPGKVVYCYWWGGYGNCVILAHANGDHTLYGHLSRIDVGYGQLVGRGQSLGKVGATGMATGPHLHLEWWHNGAYQDPMAFFYAGRIQETEFSVGRMMPVSVGGDQPSLRPALPATQGDLQVPESQREQAIEQLNSSFVYRTKEKKDSLFFE